MSRKANVNPEIRAKEFMTGARDAFKAFIPRDIIDEITVTECVEKEGAFHLTGSVGTISPTGKLKTFKYLATVLVDEDGEASLSKLQVSEL